MAAILRSDMFSEEVKRSVQLEMMRTGGCYAPVVFEESPCKLHIINEQLVPAPVSTFADYPEALPIIISVLQKNHLHEMLRCQ